MASKVRINKHVNCSNLVLISPFRLQNASMMFEHLEEYLKQACKPECDQGELTDGETALWDVSTCSTFRSRFC